MYYSIMTVGSNELFPTSTLQKAYLALMMLVGNLIIANIIGEMAVLMQVITRRSSAFQEKLDIANTIMHNIHITTATQEEIRDFFFQTRSTLEQQKELNTFLELISPSLRQSVSWHIFYEVLAKNTMLKQLEEKAKASANSNQLSGAAAAAIAQFSLKKMNSSIQQPSGAGGSKRDQEDKFGSPLGFIIQSLEIQLNRPEDVIIQQEDESTDMYFLARGDALVVMKDRLGKEHQIKRLEPGSHFGEIAMTYQTKRTATVISGNYSTFAKLTQEKFKELSQYIPELQSVIKNY
jgi:type III secretory pathway component EscS